MTMKVHPVRAIVLSAGAGAACWLLASQGAQQAALPPSLETAVITAILLCGAAAAASIALLCAAALVESTLGWRPRATNALPAPLRRLIVTSTVLAVTTAGLALPANADEAYPGWAPAAAPSASASSAPVASEPASSLSPRVDIPESSPVAEAPVVAPSTVQSPPKAPPVAPPDRGHAQDVELHAESWAPALPSASSASSASSDHADASSTATTTNPATTHVVRRGDSLWRIAAARLGDNATDADIAAAWPSIYEANRTTIGGDPGLILPGQVLTIPRAVAS